MLDWLITGAIGGLIVIGGLSAALVAIIAAGIVSDWVAGRGHTVHLYLCPECGYVGDTVDIDTHILTIHDAAGDFAQWADEMSDR